MTTAGARPMGVTPGGDYTAVIEVAREPDGSFQWTNLNIAAGTKVGPGILRPAPFPSLTGGFAATAWGSVNRRVYYANADGAVGELATDGNGWTYQNFTSGEGTPAAAWNSPLANSGMRSGTMALSYVDETGQLIIMKFSGDWTWGANPKLPQVPERSPLTAMQNGRGRFVYYFDSGNHITEVEEQGVAGKLTDLTTYASLPAASPISGLSAVGWGTDRRRVYYADRQDNLIEVVGFGDDGGWKWQNLCKLSVSQPKDGSPLAAAVGPETLAGVALWNEASEPLWASWDGGWCSRQIHTTVAANSSVASVVDSDGHPWVSYVDKDNHLSLWRGPEADWQWWDLTADLRLPAAAKVATQGPLALVHTERGPRVYYLTDEPEF
ncbi:hypothetical protein [Streptomyces sp. FIT100]|uniref:hypothetical protein n=1 Tax=Streptomyces sp. FIT100 TaxID=2837956 RepID=UPI0021C98751|nr:hypothetical protein [Streptomyces sp. FIT100]UUN30291.1 hypothetical protein KK483_31020 [Streptomyces sp. FIT100]